MDTKPICSECEITRKGWGYERLIVNNEEYCGKILVFKKGYCFSMHFHILKQETWYVNKGRFKFWWIDTEKGDKLMKFLELGEVVTIPRGLPHQLEALEDGEIFEISTQHFDSDSYRVWKGD